MCGDPCGVGRRGAVVRGSELRHHRGERHEGAHAADVWESCEEREMIAIAAIATCVCGLFNVYHMRIYTM